jgi:hypothetical protein
MAADPVVRPASGQPGDVTLAASGPRGVDVYVGPSSPTQLAGQRIDKTPAVGAAPTITGSAAITLADFTSDASGTSVAAGATGSAAITLDGFTASASGAEILTGSATVTLGDATSSATGTESIIGTSATTLSDSTSQASGTQAENATGTANITLDAFTSQATGDGGAVEEPVSGGGSRNIPTLSFKDRKSITITGIGSVTLDAFTATATGSHFIDFDAELEQLLLVGAI